MYATLEDVETDLCRELDPAETKRADSLLIRALALIKVEIPDLINKAGRDEAFAQNVGSIQINAVCRVLRNPAGIRDEREGEYAVSSVDQRVASGHLDIMPSEWRQLGVDPEKVGPKRSQKTSGYISLDAWRFMPRGGDCQ